MVTKQFNYRLVNIYDNDTVYIYFIIYKAQTGYKACLFMPYQAMFF